MIQLPEPNVSHQFGGSVKKKSTAVYLTALSIAVTILFGFVTLRELKAGDFMHHIDWARNLANRGYIFVPPHSLYEQLIVTVRAFLPYNILARSSALLHQVIDIKSFEIAAVIVTIASYLAVAFAIYFHFLRDWDAVGKHFNPWVIAAITLAAMLIAPIFLFTLPSRMYLGYLYSTPFHNPTQLLLKPLALLLFYHAWKNLYGRPTVKNIVIGAVLIVGATSSKPNFTLTFLPALGLLALMQFKKLKQLNWWYITLGLGLPAFLVLLGQFYLSFTGDGSDSIIFAPFKAILTAVPNVWALLAFTILSILFPLAVTFIYWDRTRSDLRLRLAWMNFLVAFTVAVLFSEVINMTALNFWWGPMMATFILFIETITIAGKYGLFDFQPSPRMYQKIASISVLGLHLFCGIFYYVKTLILPSIWQ